MTRRVTLLVPTGEPRVQAGEVRPVPLALTGRHVGILDNTKANFGLLASELAPILRERFGAATVTIRRKLNPSTPAPPEVLTALAKECDVVFAGSAD